jgi:flagellar biosynthesis protein
MPKPRHAAALSYDSERGGAPQVVAAGSGAVAERIIALARENGVPIHDDAGLAEALARLQLEAEVPEELWKAVAEALVWAYRLTEGKQPTAAPGRAG